MKIRHAIPALLLVCTFAASPAIAAAPTYKMVPLAGNGSTATAINKAGAVVGQYTPAQPGSQSRAFLHSHGVLTNLGVVPGDTWSGGGGLNNKNQVVGGSVQSNSAHHAFLYTGGKMRDLGAGTDAYAYGITDAGDIAGTYRSAQGEPLGFLYRNGVIRALHPLPGGKGTGAMGINQKGQIVGSAGGADGFVHAALWENGNVRDLGTLGGDSSQGLGINERGEVVGISTVKSGWPNPDFQGFIWSNGKMRKMGTLAGTVVFPVAINNRGDAVGYYGTQGLRGFLYTHQGKLYDLSSLIVHAQGWHVRIAYGINDAGQVAGEACDNSSRCVAVRLDPLCKSGHAVTGEEADASTTADEGEQQATGDEK